MMKVSKELEFNFFTANAKVQSQDKAFQLLADQSANLCGASSSVLKDVFHVRLAQRSFGMGDGLAVFDVKSTAIQKQVLAIITFEHGIAFDSLDDKPVDIMAAVLSPQVKGAEHLQSLAAVSRVLRSDDLRMALREAKNEDAMRVLFMPSQDWMVAAA